MVVGAALLVGAVALVLVQRDALIDSVRDAARLRAEEVAGILAMAPTPPEALAIGDEDEQLIQVVVPDGSVVAASRNMTSMPAVAQLRPGRSTKIPSPIGDDEIVVVAAAADTPSGPATVLVGREVNKATESTRVLIQLLLPGIPVLMLVVGLTAWRLVGRALRPVDAITREVDEISSSALHRRVTEPRGDDEVARLARTMNRMLARLEEAQHRQRRFTSDASHELRSPVASIRQHAEVAMAHPDRTTLAELAETVLAEDLRVQGLVEDLLLLARADEGAARSEEAVDVDDLVFDAADRLRASSSLVVDTTGVSGGRVHGSPGQLRRLVGNLADNAARHARTRVAFSLAEDEGTVVLRVDDDGPGIPVEDRQRVFGRFVRLDDARGRDEGGSGLGLAIVAEVAASHHGMVTAGDGPGGGARLEVRLPASAG